MTDQSSEECVCRWKDRYDPAGRMSGRDKYDALQLEYAAMLLIALRNAGELYLADLGRRNMSNNNDGWAEVERRAQEAYDNAIHSAERQKKLVEFEALAFFSLAMDSWEDRTEQDILIHKGIGRFASPAHAMDYVNDVINKTSKSDMSVACFFERIKEEVLEMMRIANNE